MAKQLEPCRTALAFFFLSLPLSNVLPVVVHGIPNKRTGFPIPVLLGDEFALDVVALFPQLADAGGQPPNTVFRKRLRLGKAAHIFKMAQYLLSLDHWPSPPSQHCAGTQPQLRQGKAAH